jgi:hypothetical protein
MMIAIVGPSGSGKSTSLRNLPPQETVILDGERKGFPFKGYKNFKILPFASVAEFDKRLAEAKDCKYLVVESFTKYSEYALKLCQTSFSGWDVWTNYAKIIRGMLDKLKASGKIVIVTAIDEIIKIPQPDGSEVARRVIGVSGQDLKRSGIEAEFLIVLFTDVTVLNGKVAYRFETNNCGVTTAKSPMGIFEERFVDNDMAQVIKKIEAYYEHA